MATDAKVRPSPARRPPAATLAAYDSPVDLARGALAVLASLKLTIVLFAMALFMVLAVTLAQAHINMWAATKEYFRPSWGIAWIQVVRLYPETWFVEWSPWGMQRFIAMLVLLGTPVAAVLTYLGLNQSPLRKSITGVVAGTGVLLATLVLAIGDVVFPQSWLAGWTEAGMQRCFAYLTLLATPIAAALMYQIARKSAFRNLITMIVATAGIMTAVFAVTMGGFIFPGGAVIAMGLAINLLAAHTVRFRVQATGLRLVAGVLVLIVGVLLTWAVIDSGHSKEGFQERPFFDYEQIWWATKVALAVFVAGGAAAAITHAVKGAARRVEFWIFVLPLGMIGWLAAWLWMPGSEAHLGDEEMRILWLLIKALLAAVVLLLGAILIFKRRAGVVVTHGGLILLMLGELLVGLYAVESALLLEEGDMKNYAVDQRYYELAFVDASDENMDRQVVVPQGVLEKEGTVSDERLPFDLKVVDYMHNTQHQIGPDGRITNLERVEQLGSDFVNPATQGFGLRIAAREAKPVTGVDQDGQDMPSAYVTLIDKKTKQPIGTYLFSTLLLDQKIEAGDTTYDVALRQKRVYKDYIVRLNDVRKDDYFGTDSPRNYSSDIQLIDVRNNTNREVHIKMNYPLRYAGDTFYQSNYDRRNGKEFTQLSVVSNMGWIIPYTACMIVGTGLIAHFLLVLMRFLRRDRMRGASSGAVVVPLVVLLCAIAYAVVFVIPPRDSGMKVFALGRMPVHYGGRIMPFDTLARNSFIHISDVETFKDNEGNRQPVMRWFLDVISHKEAAKDYKVFRIVNLELLETLKLDARPGFRYSLNEIEKEKAELDRQRELASEAFKRDKKSVTIYQKKVIELSQRLELYSWLQEAFRVPEFTPDDTNAFLDTLSKARALTGFKVALAIPNDDQKKPWVPLATAVAQQQVLDFAASKQIGTALKVAETLRDDFFEVNGDPQADRRDALIIVLAQFIVAQNPGMSAADAIAMAEQRADQLPDDLGAVVQPMVDRRVAEMREEQRNSLKFKIAEIVMDLNDGNKLDQKPHPVVDHFAGMLRAYHDNDTEKFNAEFDAYRTALEQQDSPALQTDDAWYHRIVASVFGGYYQFEAWHNTFSPFFVSCVLYLVALVLALLAWVGWTSTLNRTALWLIVFACLVHLLGLIDRIYISGRPPVTTLYSSALFVGWGCVVFGILLELLFRLGIGNVVAAMAGFLTLRVSFALAFGEIASAGDTFAPLQAVLDTQFWLATHVVCVSLGYAATYLAGALGMVYVARGLLLPWAARFSRDKVLPSLANQMAPQRYELWRSRLTLDSPPELGRELVRMIYGILCFAIIFSFIGTVLGGLWADDSWGRFWGWDPKENGALMIVLWNALVLHARWDGLVKDRGLAVLAVFGNVTTTWSHFATNELGFGLHSYGLTEGRLPILFLFIVSQLAIIALGSLPKQYWWNRDKPAVA